MTGELTVAPEGTEVPGPEAVKAAGKKQFDDLVAAVTPAAVQALQATPDKAALGTGNPQRPTAVVAEFGPETVAIPVSGSVTWNQFGFHSLTFGASEEPDGTVHLAKGGGPEGFEVPPTCSSSRHRPVASRWSSTSVPTTEGASAIPVSPAPCHRCSSATSSRSQERAPIRPMPLASGHEGRGQGRLSPSQ